MCDICLQSPCPPGCPNHHDPVVVCPVCGRECEDLFVSVFNGDVVGCDQCIRNKEALEVIQDDIEEC